MRKIVIFSIIATLTITCNNIESEVCIDGSSSVKRSSCLKEAFAYYIGCEKAPDTSSLYIMEFWVGESGFPQNDTLICFSVYNNRQLADGVAGIMYIGDYKVLVYDEKNVGGKFYDADSLIGADLSRIRSSSSMETVIACVYTIVGDSCLYLFGCLPDDFVPIKI